MIEGSISEIVVFRLLRTLRMMYDYRRLFWFSMEWFVNKVKGRNDSNLMTTINDYNECSNDVQHCYLMICKYAQTKKFILVPLGS